MHYELVYWYGIWRLTCGKITIHVCHLAQKYIKYNVNAVMQTVYNRHCLSVAPGSE